LATGKYFANGSISCSLYSNVITLSGYYETFFTLGQGVLKMLGSIYGVSIKPADLEELRSSMLSMPAHKDVPEGAPAS
jgi:2-haloacid dehalogenase